MWKLTNLYINFYLHQSTNQSTTNSDWNSGGREKLFSAIPTVCSKIQTEKRCCTNRRFVQCFFSSLKCVEASLSPGNQKGLLRNKSTFLFLTIPVHRRHRLNKKWQPSPLSFVSINPAHYRALNKTRVQILYMPVWPLKEVQTCASLCSYPDSGNVETAFKLCGDSPRCIFKLDHDINLRCLNDILRSKHLENIVAGSEVSIHAHDRGHTMVSPRIC